MSSTEKNKVDDKCVKNRQMFNNNIRNMLNGIELRVNENKLQDKDDKIRKPFTANVCHCAQIVLCRYTSALYTQQRKS
jgi:hypothetical protein